MTSGPAIVPEQMKNYVDDWKMSPGLFTGDLLFLTGMTGAGAGGTVDPDPARQIRLAFERTASVLSEAGLDCSDIVEMTSYHVGLKDHIMDFRRIREDFVSEPYPAWTAIEVAGFATSGTICELRIVACRRTGPSK